MHCGPVYLPAPDLVVNPFHALVMTSLPLSPSLQTLPPHPAAAMRTKRDLEAMEQLVARLGPTVLTALLACTTAAYLLTASQALSHAAAPLLYASLLLLANATAALLLGRFVGYPFTLSETSWASLLASTPGALATSLRLAFLLAAIRAGSLALALSGDALGRAVGAAAADAAVSTQRVPRSRLTQALGAGAVGVVLGVFGGGVGDSAVKGLLVLVMLVASSCAASAWSQVRLVTRMARSLGVGAQIADLTANLYCAFAVRAVRRQSWKIARSLALSMLFSTVTRSSPL